MRSLKVFLMLQVEVRKIGTNISWVDLGKETSVLTLAVTMVPYTPFVENAIADRNPPHVIELQYRDPSMRLSLLRQELMWFSILKARAIAC